MDGTQEVGRMGCGVLHQTLSTATSVRNKACQFCVCTSSSRINNRKTTTTTKKFLVS